MSRTAMYYLSQASLYFDNKQYQQAKALIFAGLDANPEKEIAKLLNDLLNEIRQARGFQPRLNHIPHKLSYGETK